MRHVENLAGLPFSQAAEAWLEQRKIYIRESTVGCYGDYILRLKSFFTSPLAEIHIGHILQYQALMKKKYHPGSVNHDISILAQMMRQAGLWAPIGAHYKQLPVPELDPLKVMSEEEETRFFDFASGDPEWKMAYYVALLTANSTASGKELRMLQLGAIYLHHDPPYFHVPKGMKNPNRQRSIPLNELGLVAMESLIEIANSKGSTKPDHYLFPFRQKLNFFVPYRPASEGWIRYRWSLLVDAALTAGVISFRIKPHNLRHQAITKLLDYGVPIETVRQIAGHGVDSVLTRHYHHARMEVMARAMEAIEPSRKQPGKFFAGMGRERA